MNLNVYMYRDQREFCHSLEVRRQTTENVWSVSRGQREHCQPLELLRRRTENMWSAYKSHRGQFHSLDLLQQRTENVWRLLSHYNTDCTVTIGKDGINQQVEENESSIDFGSEKI
jgi:hypothetical protein